MSISQKDVHECECKCVCVCVCESVCMWLAWRNITRKKSPNRETNVITSECYSDG